MRRRSGFVIAATLTACGLFPSLSDLTDGGADVGTPDVTDVVVAKDATPSDGGADVAADADANPCPSLHGPEMVHVPSNGQGFCIDGTEVTTTQYAEFVTAVAKGATIATPSSGVCQWNASIAPLSSTSYCNSDTNDESAHPNRPVSCVDWCDAYAFCEWRHAHLCGKMGGGTLAEAERGDPTVDEWFNACTGGSVTDPGDADPQCRSVEDFDVPLAHCHRGG
ncbi:MAG TPA: SUMF1/EgtB/PvdO family nonheme iron enzyme, partial [Polyangiaceae bacterium]